MKKILILLVMLGAYCSSFAFLTQNSWRWRNDDGSETAATWKAAQNTAIAYNSAFEVLRLRIEVFNNENDPIDVEDSLQYTTTPADDESWVNVNANDPTHAFNLAGTSSFVTQNEATTSQITGLALPFVAGKIMVTDTVLKDIAIPSKMRSEYEWTIVGTPSTLPNVTYYFKHWGATANNLPPGGTYPSLTTGATLPVKLSSFTVKSEGKQVKLEWSTATELNNDRFDVQRSGNGTSWQTILTVKGKGIASSYTAYDVTPLLGTNYYRLQQVDKNGRSSASEIKLLRLFGASSPRITVSPNPARGAINFMFENQGASNVTAILTDANGKMIHQEQFKTVQANTINRLNLKQQPTTGVYILKLNGEGVSETVKILVQ
jgi:hypothetical protein